jgi:RNA polymerase sigma-70 factor (ECF subfamily)
MIEVGDLPKTEERTLSEMFAEYAPRVRRLACRRVGRDAADDVVQEVFLRAHRAYDRYVEEGKSWSWIRLIAERVCIDVQRRSRCHDALPDVDACAGAAVDVGATDDDHTFSLVVARQQGGTVMSVLASLSPRQRRVLVLREVGGWSNDEIAAEHGMTIEGVKATLKRARATFRTTYAAHASQPGGLGAVVAVLGAVRRLRRLLRRLSVAGQAVPVQAMLVTAVAAVVLSLAHGVGVLHDGGGGDGGGRGSAEAPLALLPAALSVRQAPDGGVWDAARLASAHGKPLDAGDTAAGDPSLLAGPHVPDHGAAPEPGAPVLPPPSRAGDDGDDGVSDDGPPPPLKPGAAVSSILGTPEDPMNPQERSCLGAGRLSFCPPVVDGLLAWVKDSPMPGGSPVGTTPGDTFTEVTDGVPSPSSPSPSPSPLPSPSSDEPAPAMAEPLPLP